MTTINKTIQRTNFNGSKCQFVLPASLTRNTQVRCEPCKQLLRQCVCKLSHTNNYRAEQSSKALTSRCHGSRISVLNKLAQRKDGVAFNRFSSYFLLWRKKLIERGENHHKSDHIESIDYQQGVLRGEVHASTKKKSTKSQWVYFKLEWPISNICRYLARISLFYLLL